jgi:hypothetical protein
VFKPNDKRVISADLVTGLGSLVSADLGPRPLSGSDAVPGSFWVLVWVQGVAGGYGNGRVALDTAFETGGFWYDGSAPPWSQLSDHCQTSCRGLGRQ